MDENGKKWSKIDDSEAHCV